MKTTLMTLALAFLCGHLVAGDPVAKPEATPEPAAEAKTEAKTEPAMENKLIEIALTNMSKLKAFHAEAVIGGTGGKATLSGDLGEGSVSIIGKDPKGNTKHRIAVDGKFYLSTDGGKTWKTGDEADKDNTVLFSNLLTAPVGPHEEIWEKGEFTSKKETVDGEELLHLTKPAKGKEGGAEYWLAHEDGLKKEAEQPVFIRKAIVTIAADDGEFPITVTYTKLAKPVTIKAPAAE